MLDKAEAAHDLLTLRARAPGALTPEEQARLDGYRADEVAAAQVLHDETREGTRKAAVERLEYVAKMRIPISATAREQLERDAAWTK